MTTPVNPTFEEVINWGWMQASTPLEKALLEALLDIDSYASLLENQVANLEAEVEELDDWSVYGG